MLSVLTIYKKKPEVSVESQMNSNFPKTRSEVAIDKIRNMEHPGTLRKILGHRMIMILMRKICKIRSSKIKLTKINWYQLTGRGGGKGGVGSAGYFFN